MTSKVDYSANGFTVVFPYPFAIPADGALEVRINDVVQSAGFHIHGAGNPDGGMVVFDSEPAAGSVISLRYLGAVSISVADASAGHLGDKLVAGANVTLETVTGDGGIQQLRIAAVPSANSLDKTKNLNDLADKGVACANLGVYSTVQTNTAISAAVNPVTSAVAGLTTSVTSLNDTVAAIGSGLTNLTGRLNTEALLKADNLVGLANIPAALHNLGLDAVAYLNVAQDWSKPQRSQALQTASVGGAVALDFAQYQNFNLSLTAGVTFANPTLSAAEIGQKGTISLTPNGFAIAAMGTAWKRVGDVGAPDVITGIGRIDYHIRALDRVEYAYNDVEA